MRFEELDKKMRTYEQSLDQCIMPGVFLVVRIDGRGFSHLTKDVCQFDVPFDKKFSDIMSTTVLHLMDCGFRVIYGYTQSDEISLLFAKNESSFSRKTRKFNSVLASEAASVFSIQLGVPVAFDCRVIPLPNEEAVFDYFLWRQEDAARNALNGWCYWTLRKQGISAKQASYLLEGKSVAWKNDFLFKYGINFNSTPQWQRRGIGMYFEKYEKKAVNKLSGKEVSVLRRRIVKDEHLPMREDYRDYLSHIMKESEA